MPTTITKTIAATSSPTTPDYSTLQSWEDALPANLVTADELHVGECLDQGEFTGATNRLAISGQTTDATRYIILRCATGASFKDKAGVRTSALLFNASNGVAITSTNLYTATVSVAADYTRFEGLQIRAATGAGGSGLTRGANGTDNIRISKCIISARGCVNIDGCVGWEVTNSLLYAANTVLSSSYGNNAFRGCTLVRSANGGTALTVGYGVLTVENCACFNFTTFGGTTSGGSYAGGHNATDVASAPGSNNQTSLTFADQFEDSTNDFRAASDGDLQAGTPDATNLPDDITGLARDATTPWIGCWEVAGGGTTYDETGSGGGASLGGVAIAAGDYTLSATGGVTIGGEATIAIASAGHQERIGPSVSVLVGGFVSLTLDRNPVA